MFYFIWIWRAHRKAYSTSKTAQCWALWSDSPQRWMAFSKAPKWLGNVSHYFMSNLKITNFCWNWWTYTFLCPCLCQLACSDLTVCAVCAGTCADSPSVHYENVGHPSWTKHWVTPHGFAVVCNRKGSLEAICKEILRKPPGWLF